MSQVEKREAGPSKRGRRPIFSRDQVVDAALALVDRDGYEALSMRAIAARLGTGVATLYHHFGSLADLNDALAVVLLKEIPLLDDVKDARGTRAGLKAIAQAYARLAARYPDFERMVGPLAYQAILRLLDSALRAMVSAGVDVERAGVAWSVLQSLAQSHATYSRRHSGFRPAEMRRMLKGLDAVLRLAETGYLETSFEDRFSRILDLTIDRLLPELKAKNPKR